VNQKVEMHKPETVIYENLSPKCKSKNKQKHEAKREI